MKAAVFKEAGVLAVEEVPVLQPGPGHVLLKVSVCGICGSDLHRYAHGLMAPGVIMGHEYAGTVVAVGEGVKDWTVGDRAIRGFRGLAWPARYSAREKGFTLDIKMPGAYAEYVTAPADALFRIPEGLSDDEAALTEPLTVGVHAVRISKLKMGDAVVILGAGPIGLLLLQCVRQCGPSQIVVSEPVAARRELAKELGADVVLDPREVDVVAEAVRLTGGLGPDVVFECAGAKPTLQQALEMPRARGQVVLVALNMESVHVRPVEWVGREVQLQCAYGALGPDWDLALAMLGDRRVLAAPLISRTVSLDDIQAAFQSLLEPTDELQVLVKP